MSIRTGFMLSYYQLQPQVLIEGMRKYFATSVFCLYLFKHMKVCSLTHEKVQQWNPYNQGHKGHWKTFNLIYSTLALIGTHASSYNKLTHIFHFRKMASSPVMSSYSLLCGPHNVLSLFVTFPTATPFGCDVTWTGLAREICKAFAQSTLPWRGPWKGKQFSIA